VVGVALLHLRPVGRVHADRAERDLHRLAEAEDDGVRRRVERGAALGHRRLEHGVRAGRGRGRPGDCPGQREEQERAADHQASAS
jgi:hypothetical protein